jgi:hypothetical protein
MGEMDEIEYYRESSCLPSCYRSEFGASLQGPRIDNNITGPSTVTLILGYLSGRYEEKEQYLIYGLADFLASIGGYLGLLLGHSILDFYNIVLLAFKSK